MFPLNQAPDCVIAFVHGVGVQERQAVVDEFQESLLGFLNRRLRGQALVASRPAPAAGSLERGYDLMLEPRLGGTTSPAGGGAVIRLREVMWADLDGRLPPSFSQHLRLHRRLAGLPARADFRGFWAQQPGWWAGLKRSARAFLLYSALTGGSGAGLALSAALAPFRARYNLFAKLSGLIMEYVGDIAQLQDKPVRRAINQRLHRHLTEIMGLDRPRFLILVGHSLGNVFVADQLRRQLKPAPLPLGWISLGSPLWIIPLLDRDYPWPGELELDLELGWYNLYDPLDPVGGPVDNPSLRNPDRQWRRERTNPITAHIGYLSDDWHLGALWEAVAEGLQQPGRERARVRAPKNRRLLKLGPFLRHAAPDQLLLWTAHTRPGLHRAELFRDGRKVAQRDHMVDRGRELGRYWRFQGLEPDTEYQACFSWVENGRAWRLAGRNRRAQPLGQAPAHWPVRTAPRPETGNLRLLFASCHHPRHVFWDGAQGHAFVRRLLARLQGEARPHAQFFIGDQVYADDWWQEQLFLPWRRAGLRRRARLNTYAEVYDRFWWHPEWAELLRLAPSYMMWDDHDIRDGWGDNVHDFQGPYFKPAAWEKFQAAGRAFELFQAEGNPARPSPDDFQFTLDLGPVSLFCFDNRTYRSYRRPCELHPFGPGQMARFRRWLEEKGAERQVLIVVTSSPGVFVKPWRADFIARRLPALMRWYENAFHGEGVDDDLRDQLPGYLNRRARDAILAGLAGFLQRHPAGAKRALWVGGDVHVGGYCRIPVGQGRAIDQWIASPLTNVPNRGLHMLAAWGLPRRRAGAGPDGRSLMARRFWSKPARNVVTLALLPPPRPGQAPRVRGELIYEHGFGLKTLTRILE
jgi:hypothetical protein